MFLNFLSTKAWPAHDPDSSRAVFQLFGTTIHWYGVTMATGFIIAITISYIMWVKNKLPTHILDWLILLVVPTSIFGARLWWCLSNINNPLVDFDASKISNWVDVGQGGLAIEGGVLACIIMAAGYFHYWRESIDWHIAMDIIVPNVLLGQIMGRWGNFLNGEVYGHITSYHSLSWLPAFIRNGMYIDDGSVTAYRQPLFLYEGIINFIGYLLMYVGFRQINIRKPRIMPTGVLGSFYFVWYGTVRAILEPFRDRSDIMMWKFGTVNIWTTEVMSAIWITLGVVLITYCYVKDRRKLKLNLK